VSLRAMATAPLNLLPAGAEVIAAPLDHLCTSCHVNPRHAHGRLSRCLGCIRADAQRFRNVRAEAEAALTARAKAEQPTKICRTCKRARPLGDFARHARGKDGRRAHCRATARTAGAATAADGLDQVVSGVRPTGSARTFALLRGRSLTRRSRCWSPS
jgi:hypothetical protein